MNLFQNTFTLGIGTALLHLLWQGTLVGLLLAGLLRILKHASSELRYLVCWFALILLLVMPAITLTSSLTEKHGPVNYGSEAANQNFQSVETGSELATTSAAPAPVSFYQVFVSSLLKSRPYLAFLWMIGVLIFAVRLLWGIQNASDLKYCQVSPPPAAVELSLNSLCRQMGIRKEITLRCSNRINQPALIGWIKPVILLPASILTGLHPDQLNAILVHELVHVKRHDYLLSMVQSAVETLLFFHPAVWWISTQIRIEREFCCDNQSVSILQNKKVYLQTLAHLESLRLQAPALSLSMNDGSLLNRVHRLVTSPSQSSKDMLLQKSSFLLGLVLFAGLCVTITACNKMSLIDEPEHPLVANVELPADLKQMVAGPDIEGVITRLHEIREAQHPDALQITFAAYQQADDEELRQNIMFVFAHFNSLEGDNLLLHVAQTDEASQVRHNALLAIERRIPVTYNIEKDFRELRNHHNKRYGYPEATEEQIAALLMPLREIALDNQQEDRIRMSAIRTLSSNQSIDSFLEEVYLNSDAIRVKLSAIEHLSSMGTNHINWLLLEMASRQGKDDKFFIGHTLGNTGSLDIIYPVIEMMKAPPVEFDIPYSLETALRQLYMVIPLESFPEMDRRIDEARAAAGNLGPYEQGLDVLQDQLKKQDRPPRSAYLMH